MHSEIYSILNNQSFLQDNPTIYHYTSLETLYRILKDKSLYLTNISFMNDYSEFDQGISMFEREFKEEFKEEWQEGAGTDFMKKIKSVKNIGNYCVASFTSLRDSLSQWRSYGMNAKGIAIGWNTYKLKDFCTEQNLAFGSCVYADKFEHVFKKFIERIMPYVDQVEDINNLDNVKTFNKIILVYFIAITCFIKHAGFSEEKEIRIVTGNVKTKNRLLNKLYLPCYELNFEEKLSELITEIWIGPAANQELVKRSIELLLEEFGIKLNPNISKIPYRLLNG